MSYVLVLETIKQHWGGEYSSVRYHVFITEWDF